jgi:hypothetical protein
MTLRVIFALAGSYIEFWIDTKISDEVHQNIPVEFFTF